MKVGPVTARYDGTVTVSWRDRPGPPLRAGRSTGDEVDGARHAAGHDPRDPQRADGRAATDVELRTNLAITGRVAQFGEGRPRRRPRAPCCGPGDRARGGRVPGRVAAAAPTCPMRARSPAARAGRDPSRGRRAGLVDEPRFEMARDPRRPIGTSCTSCRAEPAARPRARRCRRPRRLLPPPEPAPARRRRRRPRLRRPRPAGAGRGLSWTPPPGAGGRAGPGPARSVLRPERPVARVARKPASPGPPGP